MTQEEKAKAYDEALKKAKDMLSYKEVRREDMEYLFPELKESEDERIRKALICGMYALKEQHKTCFASIPIDNAIAWLEKQGEQPKKHDVCDYCDQQGSCVSPCPMKLIEKQGEQKPVVIIPKFRVGDKIKTSNEESLTITKIDEKGYWSEDLFICDFDEECLWDLVEQKPAWSEEVQEEPVSEPNKELAETYLAVFNKKFPILPSLKGKQLADYKDFLNKCQQVFGLKEWGIRPIQSKLFEKLSLLWAAWGAEHLQGVGRQDEKEQDIPVSEEFEEALAREWQGYNDRGAATVDALEDNTQELAFAKGFYRGAKWQKEQIIAKAIDAHCFGFQGAALFSFRLPADNYLVGLEVKVVVIKEE